MPVDRSILTRAACCSNCTHSQIIDRFEEAAGYYCTFFDGKLVRTDENTVDGCDVCPFFEKYYAK